MPPPGWAEDRSIRELDFQKSIPGLEDKFFSAEESRMGTDEEDRNSSLAGEEDDDEGLIDLIDRIGAVKTRFEMFNNQWV